MMKFEWDTAKAASNIQEHGVSFDEAGSVFFDQLAVSGPDPEHPAEASRYMRCRTRIVPVPFASSAHVESLVWKGRSMKKVENGMRAAYKRSDFGHLERGKFFKEVAKGTTVVLLEPQQAKAFPTSEAVNKALRGLLALTEHTARVTRRSSRRARKRAAA